MKNYIVSKKHKSLDYVGASVVGAAIALSTPTSMVAKDDVTNLSDVEIIGNSDGYKVNRVSSKKITQDLIDTPQTIQVISEKLLIEQQAVSLQDALRNTPGITLNLGENGRTNEKNNIMMRGFDTQSSIYKDGVRLNNNVVNDMFNTEAIEITKGAVGADNGRGVSSGYINQVTKRAKNKDDMSLTGSYNTGKNVRLSSDLNKKIDDTTALRLNLLKHKGDIAGRDVVEIDRTGFAGMLGFGIGTDTRIDLGYERFEQNDIPDGGVPTIGLPTISNSTLEAAGITPAKANREKFYGSVSDFEDSLSNTFTLNFEHDFSSNATISNITKFNKTRQEMVITALFQPDLVDVNDPSTWTARRFRNQKWQENENLVNKTNLSASVITGPLSHNISTGLELIKEKKDTKAYANPGDMDPVSIYNPNPNDPVTGRDLSFTDVYSKATIKTASVYAFDSISINDDFMIIGGGRLDKYKLETKGASIPRGSSTLTPYDIEDEGTLKSWKIGAVYKPLENGSVYLSYASSEQPPGGEDLSLSSSDRSAANPNKDPEESETIELGTKWDIFDERLSLTAAIYKTTVKNQITEEDDGSYTQEGDKEVKGIELGLVGQITDKWSISAGFAKDDTSVDSKGGSDDGASLRFTPDWSATLWTSYQFSPDLLVGGGASYTGEQKVDRSLSGQESNRDNRLTEIDDFLVVDLMASYKISKNSSIQFNVNNVFDEEYVANTNKDGFRYTPGKSRQAILTYTYKF